jgi:leader peptidase (prepilin peptidase)/N-methyltransferase
MDTSTLSWAFLALAATLGLAFGSFANVVIWRFPRGESLSHPSSHCPRCETPIRWHDNVPVLGWLLLRGRCRSCAEPISPRYPAVELLSGLLWAAAALAFGFGARAVFAAAFFYLLLILSFIDLDTMRLPNPIVGLLAVLGLIGSALAQFSPVDAVPLVGFGGLLASPLLASIVGAVVSAGVALSIALAYSAVRKADGFGMGDVKLLGAIGIFLGPYGLMTLFFGSLAGAIAGVIVAARNGGSVTAKYPFGPFLAAGAVVATLAGPTIWGWYLGAAGL